MHENLVIIFLNWSGETYENLKTEDQQDSKSDKTPSLLTRNHSLKTHSFSREGLYTGFMMVHLRNTFEKSVKCDLYGWKPTENFVG